MARVPKSDMEIVEYRVGSGGYTDVAATTRDAMKAPRISINRP